MPRRVRPESSDIAARDRVILSDHDLAVIRKAVASDRQDGKDDRQDAAAGDGSGPGPGRPAAEPRETRPPEPRGPAPPAAMSQALPADSPAPPWRTVLANTIRLRARQWFWPTTTRWRMIIALILAAVLFCGGAVTVALTRGNPAGQEAAGAARTAAASWIARQIAPGAVVACDPQMCGVLQSNGITADRLLVLGAGKAVPHGSDVIVSTAAVRDEFGNRLAGTYAPVALASFGSGNAQVEIRVIAADGSAAYLRRLHADADARQAAGALLLRNPDVRVSPGARGELAAGQVDARLISIIGALATPYHVDITGFSGPAAGASPGVPLRSADISPAPAGSGNDAVTLNSMKTFLLAQHAPFRPADVAVVRLASGQAVLHLEFTAPSPLGLLGASN